MEPALPTWTPEQDAAFVEESNRIKAEYAKETGTSPAQADKDATSDDAAPPDKAAGEAPGADSRGTAATEGQGETPPDDAGTFDLSFLPESVRSKIRVEDEEAHAALKSGWMAHSEATKRFQEAKRLEREAENYRSITSDPEIAKVVHSMIADKLAGKPLSTPKVVEEQIPAIDPFEPATIEAHVEKRVEIALRKSMEAEAARRRAEAEAPVLAKQAVTEALVAYVAESGIDEATAKEATALANARLLARGKTWDPERVDVLMDAAVAEVRLKKAAPAPSAPANKTVPPQNGASGTATVASPVGRGGAHAAHAIPAPKYSNGLSTPPAHMTDEDYEQEMLYAMRKRFGPNVTIDDVRAGAASR